MGSIRVEARAESRTDAATIFAILKDGGTLITWRSSFDAKHFGTGWFWRAFMHYVLRNIANALAKAGENPKVLAALSRS